MNFFLPKFEASSGIRSIWNMFHSCWKFCLDNFTSGLNDSHKTIWSNKIRNHISKSSGLKLIRLIKKLSLDQRQTKILHYKICPRKNILEFLWIHIIDSSQLKLESDKFSHPFIPYTRHEAIRKEQCFHSTNSLSYDFSFTV